MPRKPKQTELPGVERTRVPEIEKAATLYAEARDERMGATEVEVKRKSTLLSALKRHRLTNYRLDDGRVAEIVPSEETVKVRAAKEEGVDVA
jgi:hypothetical protein